MRKISFNLILILVILFPDINYSQNNEIYYTRKKNKPIDQEQLLNLIQQANENIQKCDTSACTSTKQHYIASLYYALNYPKDSIEVYLNEAKNANLPYFCGFVKNMEFTVYNNTLMPEADKDYFVKTFSKEWWSCLQKECKEIEKTTRPKKEKVKETPKNIPYSQGMWSYPLLSKDFSDSILTGVEIENITGFWYIRGKF